MLVDVGSEAEFQEALPRIVQVHGREVGIVKWRGEFFALRNQCPHMLAPICKGSVGAVMNLNGLVGTITLDGDRPVIGCPWHGWQFSLRTGQAIWGERLRVQTFPTQCQAGRVLIDVPEPRRRGSKLG